ncbi:hypothetical protein O9G_002514 [Rozella allomycis CSF55]|uniref:Uncharacterized protein n=1 Tax=Rozella allomycis (strain CSF55) TaxID=988480 RepID=A0A075AYK7_ROZAC|nr:hypothetical protein O9G_002514 [Rozella allomycis CSF55]|eukprot:EPZ33802.1 hypothetical protein O9G_002514 [Rozella allomycis CSF55]
MKILLYFIILFCSCLCLLKRDLDGSCSEFNIHKTGIALRYRGSCNGEKLPWKSDFDNADLIKPDSFYVSIYGRFNDEPIRVERYPYDHVMQYHRTDSINDRWPEDHIVVENMEKYSYLNHNLENQSLYYVISFTYRYMKEGNVNEVVLNQGWLYPKSCIISSGASGTEIDVSEGANLSFHFWLKIKNPKDNKACNFNFNKIKVYLDLVKDKVDNVGLVPKLYEYYASYLKDYLTIPLDIDKSELKADAAILNFHFTIPAELGTWVGDLYTIRVYTNAISNISDTNLLFLGPKIKIFNGRKIYEDVKQTFDVEVRVKQQGEIVYFIPMYQTISADNTVLIHPDCKFSKILPFSLSMSNRSTEFEVLLPEDYYNYLNTIDYCLQVFSPPNPHLNEKAVRLFSKRELVPIFDFVSTRLQPCPNLDEFESKIVFYVLLQNEPYPDDAGGVFYLRNSFIPDDYIDIQIMFDSESGARRISVSFETLYGGERGEIYVPTLNPGRPFVTPEIATIDWKGVRRIHKFQNRITCTKNTK